MNAYTFGQMVEAIELGQVAEAGDGLRRMRLTPDGLIWLNGPYAGRLVSVQSYLLSDLWTILEEDGGGISAEEREHWRRKRTEMLENQLFERRARRLTPQDVEE